MPALFRGLTSAWASDLIGLINYGDYPGSGAGFTKWLLSTPGIDLNECLDSPEILKTPRHFFERKIRYWDCRPMPDDRSVIVSPADSKVLVGSFDGLSLFLKDKFFVYEELLGRNKEEWLEAFKEGDFALFRLTPEQYHYNHIPVDGLVRDIYEIDGTYHACNPGAVVKVVTPYSKNKRIVTVMDTDVPGGTGIGLVAMIEVVALMIGEIIQCYSGERYESPQPVVPGMFLKKGQPKSLYRPGSSTDLLIFQKGCVRFDEDIVGNMRRQDVQSRFSKGFGVPLVETDVKVRSSIAKNLEAP